MLCDIHTRKTSFDDLTQYLCGFQSLSKTMLAVAASTTSSTSAILAKSVPTTAHFVTDKRCKILVFDYILSATKVVD